MLNNGNSFQLFHQHYRRKEGNVCLMMHSKRFTYNNMVSDIVVEQSKPCIHNVFCFSGGEKKPNFSSCYSVEQCLLRLIA